MADINIKTTLGINPRQRIRKLHTIVRGASAKFDYSLVDKYFSFNLIEQITFSFKQKKKIYWYKMFKYLVPTEDTEVNESKRYYENVRISEDGTKWEADLVINPIEIGPDYYEELLEPSNGQNDLCYLIDDHFVYLQEQNCIRFMLLPQETSKLKPTSEGTELPFEITIRLNTDDQTDLTGDDAVIIEKQPSIVVLDSLYGQISTSNNTVSDEPDWLADTNKYVRE